MYSTLPLRLALVAAALLVIGGCGSSTAAPPTPQPPIVTFTTPADGSTVDGMVLLAVDVDRGTALVDQVEFFQGATSLGVDTNAPFEMMWDSMAVADGDYMLNAVVTDNNGLEDDDDCGVTVFNFNHADFFTANPYQGTAEAPEAGTAQCLACHAAVGDDIITTGHYKWEGTAENIVGFEDEIHGKTDILNNFCIAIPTNEGRCTQCHIGYGWDDDTFEFSDVTKVDCLVCHDQTGSYAKAPKTAGRPDPAVDLNAVAMSVGDNDGVPGRMGCIKCHAKAGGGDNVKHGDLAMNLLDTTEEYDVHMGTDGEDMSCVECHRVKKNAAGDVLSHGIGGMPYHSVEEGDMQSCRDCHGTPEDIHAGKPVLSIITMSAHEPLECQVCHIPTFARFKSTKIDWDWSTAGMDIAPEDIPVDEYGNPLYNKMKGTFVFGKNVRPTLRYHNRKWSKMLVGANDTFTETPVVLGEPAADYQTPGATILPFKKMVGKQVADANLDRILVPHLFGLKGGENPYWVKYDWDLALQDAEEYIFPDGPDYYSGEYTFVETVMYLTVNHEVAPAQEAWGLNGCMDCHGEVEGEPRLDWTELGYDSDPFSGGSRPD